MCEVTVRAAGKTFNVEINDFDPKKHSLIGNAVSISLVREEVRKLDLNVYWFRNSLMARKDDSPLHAVDPGEHVPVYQVDFLSSIGTQWIPKRAGALVPAPTTNPA